MPNILETFYILFKSNSDDVEKGAKKAKESTEKLGTSIESSKKETRDLGDSFSRLAEEFSGALLSFVSADAFSEQLKQAAEFSSHLFDVSKELGVSTEALDVWGRAVSQNGGSAEGFQQTLRGITKNLAQVSVYGISPIVPLLYRLGISIKDTSGHIKNAMQLLPELAKAFQKLTPLQSKEVGEELGLDEGTIKLLQRGGDGLDKIIQKQRELGALTAQNADIAKAFTDQWEDTGTSFKELFIIMDGQALPVLNRALSNLADFGKFLQNNKDAVKGFTVTLGALALAFGAVGIAALITSSTIALIVTGVLGLAAAVGWLYQEVERFKHGQDSVFSEPKNFKSFSGLRTLLHMDNPHSILHLAGGEDSEKHIAAAASSLNTITNAHPGAMINSNRNSSTSNKNTNVTTGAITVNTQATDAKGIARSLNSHLVRQIAMANGTHDDGVQA